MKSRTEKSQKDVLALLEKQKSRDKVEDVRAFWIVNAIAVKATPEVLEQLAQRPEVKLVEPDYKVKALGDTLPWGVDRINAEMVWNGTEDGTDVVGGRNAGDGINVSILDTGIDYNHPDLADNYRGGYDFVNNDDDPMDDYGHGTHCAGIVAAVDNDKGVIGTAPEVNLYGVKVLASDGYGSYSDVIAGIQWSVEHNMDIISMSFGSSYSSGDPGIESWINAAYDAGILLVGAAGNDGNSLGSGDNVIYPARYNSVIAVAATDSNNERASFSSTGPAVELAAPGVEIYSTYWPYPYKPYKNDSGTSMACPHVTGAAALVWRAYPDYNNTQIRQRLQETAEDLGAPGRDDWYGHGLVDAENAAVDRTPPASITNLNATGVGETWINWTWTNPSDEDFNHTKVWINGTFLENIYAPEHSYNATNLLPNTTYEIGTRTVDNSGNVNATWTNQTAKTMAVEGLIFDTGSPANPFPSISGIHNGTITPSCNISVSKLYTYPSPGTGGHTEYIRIWNSTDWNETATWNGYANDWHNISFDESFTLLEDETYNYTIITGSYPQIIHEPSFNAPGGTITCTEFVDANGVVHDDWIPAIRFE